VSIPHRKPQRHRANGAFLGPLWSILYDLVHAVTAHAAQFLIPIGVATFATSALGWPGALRQRQPAVRQSRGGRRGSCTGELSRAQGVRGAPLEGRDQRKPRAARVHRFGARAFPRLGGPELLDASQTMPLCHCHPGLPRWGATGDIPVSCAGPEGPTRTDKAAAFGNDPAWAQLSHCPR